jgi:hypothetical protein
MSFTVTVHDNQTGDEETQTVQDGDYVIVVTYPATCQTQVYPNGTHVITVKNCRAAREVNDDR